MKFVYRSFTLDCMNRDGGEENESNIHLKFEQCCSQFSCKGRRHLICFDLENFVQINPSVFYSSKLTHS